MKTHQLVIRNGTIFDGSGSESFSGDVAVDDGIITAVGKIDSKGQQEIDAAGHLVTPGFVDIHTHYDGQITWENTLAPSSNHGVTTVVMGNCGVGFAPCKPDEHDALIHLMEGVEDIPEIVMAKGIPWNWETFPEYLDALSKRPGDVDFAAQIPHSALRLYTMGPVRANGMEATEDERLRMTALVAEGIQAGAFGVTTSLNWGHRTAKGEPAPSTASNEAELLALADGLAQARNGVFQIIANGHYGTDPAAEMDLMRRIAKASGRPLSYSLAQKPPYLDQPWKMLELTAQAQAEGLSIKAQVFPRPIGLLFGLELSLHPFRFHPSYVEISHLPVEERVKEMKKRERRAAILSESPLHSNPLYIRLVSDIENIYSLSDPPNYEPDPASSLGARAAREKISPAELAYDLLLEKDGRQVLLAPSSNYAEGNLEAVRRMLTDPNSLIGLGDGGAHYGMICDSSYPTSLLTWWTRDRPTGKLPLAWAIKSLSLDNALAVGMKDRGRIAPGFKADMNVIDYKNLRLHAPHQQADLPAGGKRLSQKADGYMATIVSGEITYRNGIHTGQLPGRLVRNQRT